VRGVKNGGGWWGGRDEYATHVRLLEARAICSAGLLRFQAAPELFGWWGPAAD
jgi:hypothetical protein